MKSLDEIKPSRGEICLVIEAQTPGALEKKRGDITGESSGPRTGRAGVRRSEEVKNWSTDLISMVVS